jgi:hypothetical protein
MWKVDVGGAFQAARIPEGRFAGNTSHISDFNPYTHLITYPITFQPQFLFDRLFWAPNHLYHCLDYTQYC